MSRRGRRRAVGSVCGVTGVLLYAAILPSSSAATSLTKSVQLHTILQQKERSHY